MTFKEWLKDKDPELLLSYEEGWRDTLRKMYAVPMMAATLMGGPEQAVGQFAASGGQKAPMVATDDAWEQEERRRRQAIQSQTAVANRQAALPRVGAAKMKRRMHRR